MLEAITKRSVKKISNPDFRAYAQVYIDVEEGFREQIASFGLPISSKRSAEDLSGYPALPDYLSDLAERGLHIENDSKSLWINRLSPACEICRKGEDTETFLASTQCPRDCFFCFNPNQEDYEYYLHNVNDIVGSLEERHASGVHYEDIALTGGEPLLHKQETLAFFTRAKELYPKAYTRLYTSGAGLDEACRDALRQAQLNEIRFSIKTDDKPAVQQDTFDKIAQSKEYFEAVVVEMPVMPDNLEQMKVLLKILNEIGISSINLLELCFPLHNAPEFAKCGYEIKALPYRVLYDYWYAGGLPIAGSEENCLRLLEFSLDEGLKIGVHYCSLENKFSGQIYQQNKVGGEQFPLYAMSPKDYFLKSAKAFGEDAQQAKDFFDEHGMTEYREDKQDSLVDFRLDYLEALKVEFPDMAIGISYYVAEFREGEWVLRELRIDRTTPATFDFESDL